MNGKDILSGLGHVDEKFVCEAEVIKLTKSKHIFKFALPIAVSITIMMLVFITYLNRDTLIITPQPEKLPANINHSTDSYKLQFNDIMMSSLNKEAIKGHFWYDLDAEQAKKVLPMISQKYDMKGTVHYSSEGNQAALYKVSNTVSVNGNMSGNIIVSPNEIVNDCVIVGEAKISQIEGIPIEAGLFITDKNSEGNQNYMYYANFKIDDIAYYMEFTSNNEKAEDVFTRLVEDVILGGKADISVFDNPTIPTIVEQELSENEAYGEADFGKYLMEIPSHYLFNSANRLRNQDQNMLFASWSNGHNDISMIVSSLDENSKERIVSPKDITLYDMSLYTTPWVDSMPEDTYYIIENPVFRIEDVTLAMMKARGYTRNEAGDSSENLNMRFSILYNDVVVEVNSEGLSAEYLYNHLTSLPNK